MIRCLLIDDEPYARQLLSKYIAEFNDMEVAGSCKSIQDAIPVLQSENIDLLFLDVKMPKVTGVEFLEQAKHLPEVVLTTAYREYAVQAYEFGVLDYLLKPVSFLRFAKAVDRFRQKQINAVVDKMNQPVVFKSGFEYHKILPADILYIQSIKEYVSIVCSNGKYFVRSTMSEMLLQLPYSGFIQVHKSYIVANARIASVTSGKVLLEGDIDIPLGRSFARQVRTAFSGAY